MYSVGSKIVSVENKFPEKRVNSLTFQTRDSVFPDNTIGDGSRITFGTSVIQSLSINYGDGTILIIGSVNGEMGVCNGSAEGRLGHLPQHTFLDTENNGSLRNITFDFEFITGLTSFVSFYSRLYGAFPVDLGLATSLRDITLNRTYELETFPDEISTIKGLESLALIGAFKASSKPVKLPDGLFSTALEKLIVTGSFDFQDNISSNLFKINQLSNTLTSLEISSCGITEIPKEVTQLELLNLINIDGDGVEKLENLSNLSVLRYGPPVSEFNKFFKADNFTGVSLLILNYRGSGINDFSDISLKWSGFKSLKNLQSIFNFLDKLNVNFNRFIDSFYTLCINNGFLDPSSQQAINTNYPEQFRNITWGDGRAIQTGEILEPTGYVQGVNNGSPTNQGQKIYVLVNNYGHTITTA
jgi:Leucine-rich repeat (LRR) protein